MTLFERKVRQVERVPEGFLVFFFSFLPTKLDTELPSPDYVIERAQMLPLMSYIRDQAD
jgi:hypothetical protein